ncbi:MAG TPA: hypothetical protein VFR47_21200 [Anaerolineales bacterium]|nr:hypothetical protein [Anaerolineales bacterium]
MKCPNCQHTTSDTAILQCSQCGEAFERNLLEEYQHLEYLSRWLSNRTELSVSQVKQLTALVGNKQSEILAQLLPKTTQAAEELAEAKPAPLVEIAQAVQPAPAIPAPEPPPAQEPVAAPAPASIAQPAIAPESRANPRPVIVPPPATATTRKPAVIRTPAAPPKPAVPQRAKRPPVDWKKVREGLADAVTSGALLRALLYLGAFMIVISATVLVIRFWNQFNPVLQLTFIASVPLMFYAGGWFVRSRLQLTQAGTVLTGIGAILVAVDFAAIYQLTGLAQRVNGPAYWLVVSLFCTALYTFTAWRLQGEFFDALTLLSGAGVFVALTRIPTPKLPLEWTVVSLTFSGVGMVMLAGRFSSASDAWRRFARIARYLSQILIPASVFYVVFAPRDLPIAVGFLFATIGYGLLAWRFPSILFAYAALGSSIGVVLYGLNYADVGYEWFAMTASILALFYILTGQGLNRARLDTIILQYYVRALNTTAFILIGLASVSGLVFSFTHIWAGVLALSIASLDLAACAYIFKHPRYTLLASSLFIVPFSFAFWEWFTTARLAQPLGWLTVAWMGLSLAYMGVGVLLRKVEGHATWLHLLAQALALFTLAVLPLEYLSGNTKAWSYIPASIALGLTVALYVLTIIMHDSGGHPALSSWVNGLPAPLGKSAFLFPGGLLFPIWIAVIWYGNQLSSEWFGALLAGFGIAYIGLGQWLFKRTREYRLPLHLYPYLFFLIGILLATTNQYALLAALLITVTSLGILAYFYNRAIETTLAGLLLIWSFVITLDLLKVPQQARGLAFVLLACLVYVPVAIYLNRFQRSHEKLHPIPIFVIGYLLSAFAIYDSIVWSMRDVSIPWLGVLVPLIATALYVYSTSYFKDEAWSEGWAWLATLTFAITFRQTLTFFQSPTQYDAFAWVAFAALYMIVERLLNSGVGQRRRGPATRGMATLAAHSGSKLPESSVWFKKFHLPLTAGFIIIAALGLFLSLPGTLAAFRGFMLIDYLPPIVAQTALVLLLIASARLYRTRLPMFIEPALAFLPVTLFFIGYGEALFGKPLDTPQYALAWTGLGLAHFVAAIFVDKSKERHAHGLFLGGYILLSWAVLWSLLERPVLVWTLGLWVFAAVLSALLVHFGRHRTWKDFLQVLFGDTQPKIRTIVTNAFQWLAAWTFPIWCVILLRELAVPAAFAWLGLVNPPLAYLGLAPWLRRVDSSYATPLNSAAHFYTAIGLLLSLPVTFDYLVNYSLPTEGKATLLAFIILQALAVIFYAVAAWMSKARGFAHVAAWLSVSAFSITWQAYGVELTPVILVIPWLAWSAILLAIGFLLDRREVRYAHGPYLAGYALMIYALVLSSQVRLTNIYALAITILLSVISYLLVHFGQHRSFEDVVNFFWKRADDTTRRIAATLFLFFAAYAFPVWLAQVLAYNHYPLAWRGMGLAVIAPLYIAIGLAIRHSKAQGIPTVPTWPLYSAAYALTAIGAMVAFEEEQVAIYVLTLDAAVYAVSAYLFRQSFWLYLTTVLAPIIVLLTLHNSDQLKTNLVAWIFMAFAFVYLGVGQAFDRIRNTTLRSVSLLNGDINVAIHPFAAPFYAPGFVLSAISLALASQEKMLAIQVYSAGVILYALSSVLFHETVFYYPAAWLAAVPYFLTVTLTPLETRWYGLAWLPLILLYIGLGRFVFHHRKLAPLGKGFLVDWLTHPAVPFYLLAYALSVSMISLSYVEPLPLTIAFGVAGLLYLVSAYLFKKPAWIYPGLFAAHMTVLAYFAINPSGGPIRYITIPFLIMTWVTSLIGYAFERQKYPETAEAEDEGQGTYRFSIFQHLFGHPWARPFFAFAIFEMLIWQSLALTGYDTTILIASGYALLFALFSILWVEGTLVYGAVGFGLLAAGASLMQAEFQFADAAAVFGGIGFGLYLLSGIMRVLASRVKALTVWSSPLTNCAVALTGAAVVVTLPVLFSHMTAAAASLAFAGALYVTIAYRGRYHQLGYLGMALLQLAWVLLLFINDVKQPQLYAIPAGLYFMGLAYLEWQRNKSRYSVGLEILGLGVLLVTSLAQSLNAQGLPYFVLLMAEGLLVVFWGLYQRRKIPFFTGIGASTLNVVAQVIVLVSVHDINRWFLAFGVGLLIMSLAIYIERSREQLRTRARELSETLEKWE